MRILLCMPEYPPDRIGGGGLVAEALFKEYSKRHDVRVIAGRIGIAPCAPDPSGRIVRIPEYGYPPSLTFMASTMPPKVTAFPEIFRKTVGFDVAHVHGYGFPLMDAVTLAARLNRIPIVKTLHGFPVTPAKRGGIVAAAFSAYRSISGDPALRAAAKHTAVSTPVAKLYAERYSINCRVVPNGVTELPPAPARDGDPSTFTILCVGRLEWLKRFDTVVEAIASLPENVHLEIVGRDNGEQSRLQTLAASLGVAARVHFSGYLPPVGVASAYARADCCVMSSETEAFPAVPLEAMKQGVPLVCTPVGATTEYGIDHENLIFYPIGDSNALACALREVIESRDLQSKLVSNGKMTAARYSWDAVARQYEQIFEEVVSGK